MARNAPSYIIRCTPDFDSDSLTLWHPNRPSLPDFVLYSVYRQTILLVNGEPKGVNGLKSKPLLPVSNNKVRIKVSIDFSLE